MSPCHDFSFILNFSGTAPRLLVRNDALPATMNPPHFWQTCQPVNHAVRDQFGNRRVVAEHHAGEAPLGAADGV